MRLCTSRAPWCTRSPFRGLRLPRRMALIAFRRSAGTADSHLRGAAVSSTNPVTVPCAGIDTAVPDRGHWTGEQCRPASHLRHRPLCRGPGERHRPAPRGRRRDHRSAPRVRHRGPAHAGAGHRGLAAFPAPGSQQRGQPTHAADRPGRRPGSRTGRPVPAGIRPHKLGAAGPQRRQPQVVGAATATAAGDVDPPAGQGHPGSRARTGQLDEDRGGVLRARRRLGAATRTAGSDRLHALPEVVDILANQPGRRAAVRVRPGAGIGSHLFGA